MLIITAGGGWLVNQFKGIVRKAKLLANISNQVTAWCRSWPVEYFFVISIISIINYAEDTWLLCRHQCWLEHKYSSNVNDTHNRSKMSEKNYFKSLPNYKSFFPNIIIMTVDYRKIGQMISVYVCLNDTRLLANSSHGKVVALWWADFVRVTS